VKLSSLGARPLREDPQRPHFGQSHNSLASRSVDLLLYPAIKSRKRFGDGAIEIVKLPAEIIMGRDGTQPIRSPFQCDLPSAAT
jgi:hypothetical protein